MHDRSCSVTILSKPDFEKAYLIARRCLSQATHAFIHPLGFSHINIQNYDTGGYARLHIWKHSPLLPDVPHTHSGIMKSTILAGTIANKEWTSTRSSEGPFFNVYTVAPINEVARFNTFKFEASLEPCDVIELHPGQAYIVPSGVFHSNDCHSKICITLVERGPKVDNVALVASELLPGRQVIQNRIALSSKFISEMIALLDTSYLAYEPSDIVKRPEGDAIAP